MTKCFVRPETSHQWCTKGFDDDDEGGEEEELRAGLQLAGLKKARGGFVGLFSFQTQTFNTIVCTCPALSEPDNLHGRKTVGEDEPHWDCARKMSSGAVLKKSTDWKNKSVFSEKQTANTLHSSSQG